MFMWTLFQGNWALMVFVSPNHHNKSQDNLPELIKEVFKETVVQNVIISSHFVLLHY
jgi:hypothetical protein